MPFDSFNTFDTGFGLMSVLFPIFFFGIFLIVIISFVVVGFSSLKSWNKNNNSPRLNVTAKIVSKRADIRRGSSSHHNMDHTTSSMSSSTTYYVTFEVQSGDRMELAMYGQDYGLLIEGDEGMLTFQGTRYISFERTR